MQVVMDMSKPTETVACWVALYSSDLYSWAVYKTGQAGVAEDLVQEVFLQAFEHFQRFEGRSEPKTWLFSILNNKIADHFRKVYRQPDRVISGSTGETAAVSEDSYFQPDGNWQKDQEPRIWPQESGELLDNPDFQLIMKECLSRLPEKWHAALQLRYLEQKDSQFVCQELQLSSTNFWQILHRAKLQLRRCLELHWFKH